MPKWRRPANSIFLVWRISEAVPSVDKTVACICHKYQPWFLHSTAPIIASVCGNKTWRFNTSNAISRQWTRSWVSCILVPSSQRFSLRLSLPFCYVCGSWTRSFHSADAINCKRTGFWGTFIYLLRSRLHFSILPLHPLPPTLSHLTGHFSTVIRRVHKIAKSDYSLGHVRRPSVRPHGKTRLPLEEF